MAGIGVHADGRLEIAADLLMLGSDAIGLDHIFTLDERDAQRLRLTYGNERHRGGLAVGGPLGCVQGWAVEFIGESQLHIGSGIGRVQGGRQGEEAEELFHRGE